MRIAAIDIGTNSVHMIVVELRPDLSFEVVDQEKEMVRLGAGGLDGRALTDAAMQAGLQALTKFRRLATAMGADEIIAVATSATREAENGGDFLDAVAAATGIHARVITGNEEARLVHLAAVYGIDLAGGRGVVLDIGGGSVEITYGDAVKPLLGRSFKAGVIRLTERFVKSDPLSPRDERRLVKHVTRETADYVRRIADRRFQRVIGTSGTILSLGALALTDGGHGPPTDVRNLRVPAKAIHRLRKRLLAMDLKERLALPGLDPRRADLSVAGVVLLDTLLRQLGADELTLCDLALREGVVLDFVRRHRAQIAAVDRYPDIRRRSVHELAARCRYDEPHARQVAALSLSLFDQTRDVHGFGDAEREWLEYSAILHDIGTHISHRGHHKHSYYLIKHGDLRGFDPEEIEVIALVARTHRRGAPRRGHSMFRDLPQRQRRVVRALSGFVRVAEGLDRSHAQLVSAVDLDAGAAECTLRVHTSEDVELELWAAHRDVTSLEKLLGRRCRFDLVQTPAARRARRRTRSSRRAAPAGASAARRRSPATPFGKPPGDAASARPRRRDGAA